MRVQIYNFYMKLLKKSGGLNSLFAFLLRLFNATRALLAQFLAIIPLFVRFFDGCTCLRGEGRDGRVYSACRKVLESGEIINNYLYNEK